MLPYLFMRAYVSWVLGHARTLCNFAARFVKATGIPVTYITTQGILDKLMLEIARSFTPEEAHFQKLIRYVHI